MGPSSIQSDGSLAVYANGHPKSHKHNNSAQVCGIPYPNRRPHSIHGQSALAQKSMDSLSLNNVSGPEPARRKTAMASIQQDSRMTRSSHGTPDAKPISNLEYLNSQIPPLNLTDYSAWNFNHSPCQEEYSATSTGGFESYLTTPDEQAVFSAGLNMPAVDWSAFDLPMDQTTFSQSSQPPSYASFDYSNVGYPGMTASSSGDVSDIGEDQYQSSTQSQSPGLPENPRGISIPDLSGSKNSSNHSPDPAYHSFNMENLDIDAYLKNATVNAQRVDEFHGHPIPTDSEDLIKHGITVREAQRLAHEAPSALRPNALNLIKAPSATIANIDPSWSGSYNGDDDQSNYMSDDQNFEIEAQMTHDVWTS
ncbi:hypothetical protein MMC25_003246 [Agyrium rufum]|nr:hypothetical protein [Agyrium rufum]